MKIRRHIPTFAFDPDYIPKDIEFSNLNELLSIDFVKNSTSLFSDFYRFSISDNLLMAEYNKGYKWWAVGHLSGDYSSLNLPKWVPLYTKEEEEKRKRINDEIIRRNNSWKTNREK